MRDMVLVLNFDDAASRTVTRKLRAERVFCRIIPGDTPAEEILGQEPLGLLLAGGAQGEALPYSFDPGILRADVPLLALGDCAGALLKALGGCCGEKVLTGAVAPVEYTPCELFTGLENGERLLPCLREMRLPEGCKSICRAFETTAGFACAGRPVYGVQLQAEPNDPDSSLFLRNFALDICGCTTWWDDDAFADRAVEEIRRVVGDGTAVCAMTGGLDSGVSALLAFRALGNRLKCVFVDTGLLRENEGDDFMAFYREKIGLNVIRVCAQDRFLSALDGLAAGREKRAAISRVMQEVLDGSRAQLGHFDVLIRGTSCNDVMMYRNADRPTLSRDVPVVEPVRELFKDEIRRIGDFLGLPPDIVSRQPFPGSGLALRILGEVTVDRLRVLRTADAIFRSEVQKNGIARKLWQYFAVLAPAPGKPEENVITLRAVQVSTRASAARLPYEVAENTVERVMNACPSVKRVVYDLTPSDHYTGIEW